MTAQDVVQEEVGLVSLDDLDSLEYLELIQKLEKVFDVLIPDQRAQEVQTLGELCGIVDELRAAKDHVSG